MNHELVSNELSGFLAIQLSHLQQSLQYPREGKYKREEILVFLNLKKFW